MKEYVGKRIMEIADIMKAVIFAFAIVIGGINILTGIIALVTTEDFSSDVGNPIFSLVIQPILVGVIWIAVGTFIAECATILTYGFGILVDRAEHLKAGYFDDEMAQEAAIPQPLQVQRQPVPPSPNTSAVNQSKSWICSCGYKNFNNLGKCNSCGQPKPVAPKPGSSSSWTCSCGYKNFNNFGKCNNCGQPKP